HDVVMRHLHAEAASTLRHGSEIGTVAEHFCHGNLSFDDRIAALVVHALNAPAAGVEIAHDATGKFVRDRYLDGHYRLEQRRFRLFHSLRKPMRPAILNESSFESTSW